MSCIKEGNTRCTKCCEAIAVTSLFLSVWRPPVEGGVTYTGQEEIRSLWTPISRRQAKKINPYAVSFRDRCSDSYIWFKCKALVDGVCTVRDERPDVCRTYVGDDSYSPTCQTDINIIARSSD